jgi:hypothetical protein
MLAVNHFGGSAVVHTYPWGQYDCVVDVAGGVGAFLAELLATHSGLRQGVVLDLPSNINRTQQVGVQEVVDSVLVPCRAYAPWVCRTHLTASLL